MNTTMLEDLIRTHRIKIGTHLLAAKAIFDSGEAESRATEFNEHFRQANRRFGIVSGLVFAAGVMLSAEKMNKFVAELEITEGELNDLARNATDLEPKFMDGGFAE